MQRQVEVQGEGLEGEMAGGVKQEAGEMQGQGLLATAARGTAAEGATAGEAGGPVADCWPGQAWHCGMEWGRG